MNWDRGFSRLYIALTIGWMVFATMYWHGKALMPLSLQEENEQTWELLFDSFERAVYVWLGVSIVWVVLRWLIKGFLPDKNRP